MLVLVALGGMASFGLWAFTHADRISTLEAETKRLVSLQADMKVLQGTLGTGSDESKVKLDRLLKEVDDYYKTTPDKV